MKKISGKEFKDFYFDEKFWPKDDGETYVDDMEILVDGQVFNDVVDISDNSVVSLVNGVVINPLLPDGYCSLKSFFLKWRKVDAPDCRSSFLEDAGQPGAVACSQGG